MKAYTEITLSDEQIEKIGDIAAKAKEFFSSNKKQVYDLPDKTVIPFGIEYTYGYVCKSWFMYIGRSVPSLLAIGTAFTHSPTNTCTLDQDAVSLLVNCGVLEER